MNDPNMVQIRNGAWVPQPIVHTTWLNLELLSMDSPDVLFEAAQVARDPGRAPVMGMTFLQQLDLLDTQGRMHEYTRQVVLSAVEETPPPTYNSSGRCLPDRSRRMGVAVAQVL